MEDKLKTSGIYMILNTVNNKSYIGSSVNFHNRKRQHLGYLIKNNHHSQHLQHAFDKYGRESFRFIILERGVNAEDLLARELHWIKLKNTISRDFGYNIAIPDPDTHHKFTDETKFIMTKNRLKYWYKREFSDKEIEDFIAKRDNDKIINKKNTLKRKYEHMVYMIDKSTCKLYRVYDNINSCIDDNAGFNKKKISDVLYGYKKSYKKYVFVYKKNYDENKSYKVVRSKKIYQYSKDFELIKIYNSPKDLPEEFNYGSISSAVSKKHTYAGFYWSRSDINKND